MNPTEPSPAPERTMTWEPEPVEETALPEEAVEEKPKEEAPVPQALPEPAAGAVPSWALLPEGLKAPRGRAVFFARFPSPWTDTPREGVPWGALTELEMLDFKRFGIPAPELGRQCIFWALSIGDQKIALGRANGDPNRFNSELAKQMIRSVDGEIVDRSGVGTSGNLEIWWNQIGERCRSELTRACLRIHSLTAGERAVFFAHCVASRTAG